MAALKESMQAKGRAKVRDAVRRRMGKAEKEEPRPTLRLQGPDRARVEQRIETKAAFCGEKEKPRPSRGFPLPMRSPVFVARISPLTKVVQRGRTGATKRQDVQFN
jgi:hypothetical protein